MSTKWDGDEVIRQLSHFDMDHRCMAAADLRRHLRQRDAILSERQLASAATFLISAMKSDPSAEVKRAAGLALSEVYIHAAIRNDTSLVEGVTDHLCALLCLGSGQSPKRLEERDGAQLVLTSVIDTTRELNATLPTKDFQTLANIIGLSLGTALHTSLTKSESVSEQASECALKLLCDLAKVMNGSGAGTPHELAIEISCHATAEIETLSRIGPRGYGRLLCETSIALSGSELLELLDVLHEALSEPTPFQPHLWELAQVTSSVVCKNKDRFVLGPREITLNRRMVKSLTRATRDLLYILNYVIKTNLNCIFNTNGIPSMQCLEHGISGLEVIANESNEFLSTLRGEPDHFELLEELIESVASQISTSDFSYDPEDAGELFATETETGGNETSSDDDWDIELTPDDFPHETFSTQTITWRIKPFFFTLWLSTWPQLACGTKSLATYAQYSFEAVEFVLQFGTQRSLKPQVHQLMQTLVDTCIEHGDFDLLRKRFARDLLPLMITSLDATVLQIIKTLRDHKLIDTSKLLKSFSGTQFDDATSEAHSILAIDLLSTTKEENIAKSSIISRSFFKLLVDPRFTLASDLDIWPQIAAVFCSSGCELEDPQLLTEDPSPKILAFWSQALQNVNVITPSILTRLRQLILLWRGKAIDDSMSHLAWLKCTREILLLSLMMEEFEQSSMTQWLQCILDAGTQRTSFVNEKLLGVLRNESSLMRVCCCSDGCLVDVLSELTFFVVTHEDVVVFSHPQLFAPLQTWRDHQNYKHIDGAPNLNTPLLRLERNLLEVWPPDKRPRLVSADVSAIALLQHMPITRDETFETPSPLEISLRYLEIGTHLEEILTLDFVTILCRRLANILRGSQGKLALSSPATVTTIRTLVERGYCDLVVDELMSGDLEWTIRNIDGHLRRLIADEMALQFERVKGELKPTLTSALCLSCVEPSEAAKVIETFPVDKQKEITLSLSLQRYAFSLSNDHPFVECKHLLVFTLADPSVTLQDVTESLLFLQACTKNQKGRQLTLTLQSMENVFAHLEDVVRSHARFVVKVDIGGGATDTIDESINCRKISMSLIAQWLHDLPEADAQRPKGLLQHPQLNSIVESIYLGLGEADHILAHLSVRALRRLISHFHASWDIISARRVDFESLMNLVEAYYERQRKKDGESVAVLKRLDSVQLVRSTITTLFE